MPLFGELERFAADLYPYRWPITIGLVVLAAGALFVAYRLRWHAAIWRRRLLAGAVAVPLLAVTLPVGWYTLSPLWERSHLEEASPLVEASTDTVATPATPGPDSATRPTATPTVFEPRVTHRGDVAGADDFHFGRGQALIIETEPGRYVLRFEDFSVRNGPDLFVYLTPAEDGDSVDGAINLGALKATDGAFNYEIPDGTDIERFRSAIVWCRQFAVLFASAPLTPA